MKITVKEYNRQKINNNLMTNERLISERENKITRLKELLTIKRDAQVILDDDTVNSWMTDKDVTRRYTEAQVKQAAEDYNNAVKETDLIIEGL